MFVKQPSLNFYRKIEKNRFCLFEFLTNENLTERSDLRFGILGINNL